MYRLLEIDSQKRPEIEEVMKLLAVEEPIVKNSLSNDRAVRAVLIITKVVLDYLRQLMLLLMSCSPFLPRFTVLAGTMALIATEVYSQ